MRPDTVSSRCFWAVLAIAFCLATPDAIGQRSELTLSEDAEAIRQAVNIDNIKRDIARFTALPTRVTGYSAADNAAKYVFNRMQELGLEDVNTRTFSLTVPIDAGTGRLVVRAPNGETLRTILIRGLWPNLVRVPLVPNGLKHRVSVGETLVSIAEAYRVPVDAIVDDPRNEALRNQRHDRLDNDNDGFVDDADQDGEITPVADTSLFIPTGGLEGRLIYGGRAGLSEFDGKPVGGSWYEVQPDDALEVVA